VQSNAYLSEQQDIIYASAILHDMCDKKYMVEKLGLSIMKNHMGDIMPISRLDTVSTIISTMSYSKVKQNGFPLLDEYQLAYHIVREADLLAAYDIDRTIMYGMIMEKLEYCDAVVRAIHLFDKRILKYREDQLFVTNISKEISFKLHEKAVHDIEELKTTFCS
jgi:HD superfamily phosphodiesterase